MCTETFTLGDLQAAVFAKELETQAPYNPLAKLSYKQLQELVSMVIVENFVACLKNQHPLYIEYIETLVTS